MPASDDIELLLRIYKTGKESDKFRAGDSNVLSDTAFTSAMKMMGVERDTQMAFGMRHSVEVIMNNDFRPEEITVKDSTVVVKIFLDTVTADGRPQYPLDIFMKQRAELAQWRADKLEEIV